MCGELVIAVIDWLKDDDCALDTKLDMLRRHNYDRRQPKRKWESAETSRPARGIGSSARN
jgi:hypothetical protein